MQIGNAAPKRLISRPKKFSSIVFGDAQLPGRARFAGISSEATRIHLGFPQ
jgi:hypothetical protein